MTNDLQWIALHHPVGVVFEVVSVNRISRKRTKIFTDSCDGVSDNPSGYDLLDKHELLAGKITI